MAKCCPCIGQSARVRCVCVKKNCVCLSCCPLKAGKCQNSIQNSMTKTGNCIKLGRAVQLSSLCSSASNVCSDDSDNSVDAHVLLF